MPISFLSLHCNHEDMNGGCVGGKKIPTMQFTMRWLKIMNFMYLLFVRRPFSHVCENPRQQPECEVHRDPHSGPVFLPDRISDERREQSNSKCLTRYTNYECSDVLVTVLHVYCSSE